MCCHKETNAGLIASPPQGGATVAVSQGTMRARLYEKSLIMAGNHGNSQTIDTHPSSSLGWEEYVSAQFPKLVNQLFY